MFWKTFSLLAVTVSFLALVVWVYLPRNKERFDAYGSMPLENEPNIHTLHETTEEKP